MGTAQRHFLSSPLPTHHHHFLFHGRTYTEYSLDASTLSIIDGRTLDPGGAIIISGTVMSLASDGADIVIDGSTQHLSNPYAATSIAAGTGEMIMSGLGGDPTPTGGEGGSLL